MKILTRPLRIGELAKELGLNPKTIRYYEDLGLLPKAQRSEAGYRLYDETDRQRLTFVRKARAIGLSLDEIQELLDLRGHGKQPCEHLSELATQKIADIDNQLQALQAFREELVLLEAEAASGICGDGEICAVIERHSLKENPQAIIPLRSISRPR